MKKIGLILSIFLITGTLFIYSENSGVMEWSMGKDFLDSIYSMTNIDLVRSNGKPVYFEISKKKVEIDSNTDLYLSFDRQAGSDFRGNYKTAYSTFKHNETKSVINESGFFYKAGDRIELLGNNRSFFQPGVSLGSFTISFWIHPLSFSNYDTILKIGSQYYDEKTDIVEEQSIVLRMEEGRAFLEFNNLFSSTNYKKPLIQLESYDRIIPGRWSHVAIYYDQYTGQVEMYINGVQSALALATVDGTLNSTILNMRYDIKNRCVLNLAPSFTGAIDEFFISRGVKRMNSEKYNQAGGELVSNVERLDRMGGYIKKIVIDDMADNNSRLLYYCRFSEKPFYSDDRFSKDIPWVPLRLESLENRRVKYFQWKAIFLPGKNNENSPLFRELKLYYDKDLPPSKPIGIKIQEGDGSIKLKWLMNSEKDLKGYKIYYGTRSGNYFGTGATEGISPIDVGKVDSFEITGLKNNIIYYFVITAYDDEEKIHESEFSEEVFGRPLSIDY